MRELQFQPIVGDDYQSGVCTLPRQHWPSQSVQSMSMTMSPPMLYTGLGVVSRTCPSGALLTKDVEARIPAQCCIQSQKDGKISTPIVMAKRESSVWHFCRSQTSHVWTNHRSACCFSSRVSVAEWFPIGGTGGRLTTEPSLGTYGWITKCCFVSDVFFVVAIGKTAMKFRWTARRSFGLDSHRAGRIVWRSSGHYWSFSFYCPCTVNKEILYK